MKKIFLIGSALLLASTFASAEVINGPGARMEVNDNGVDIISAMGQVLSLSPGKAVINTNNPDMPSLSQEMVDENTVRIGIGDAFMNIQRDPNNPDEVRFLGPTGEVLKTISKKVDANGREVLEMRDGKTNELTTHATTHADGKITGEIHEDIGKHRLDMRIENGKVVRGTADISSQNYKKEIGINNGNIEIVVKDNSGKLLYRAVGNNDQGRIYDGSCNLIAEGEGENEEDMRIYNQAAYDEFERIMNDDVDDDDDMDFGF